MEFEVKSSVDPLVYNRITRADLKKIVDFAKQIQPVGGDYSVDVRAVVRIVFPGRYYTDHTMRKIFAECDRCGVNRRFKRQCNDDCTQDQAYAKPAEPTERQSVKTSFNLPLGTWKRLQIVSASIGVPMANLVADLIDAKYPNVHVRGLDRP